MCLTSSRTTALASLLGIAGLCVAPVAGYAQTIQQSGTAIGGEILRPIEQVPWFNNPDVRNQIKLNNDQYNALTKDYDTYWKNYTTGRTALDDELDDIQRREREAALHREFQQNLSKSLDRVLTDRIARRRYDELYNQYQGSRVFHDPRIRKQLDLTSEQLAELSALDREWDRELERIRNNFEINRPVAMRELKHARRAMRERILDTLTPEQNERYAQLTGEPYEFPETVYIPTPPKPRVEAVSPADVEK